MNVFFYAPMKSSVSKRLQQKIEAVVPIEEMEIYTRIDTFSKRLCKPLLDDRSVAVLLAVTKEELKEILSIQDLITDLRVIVVLPDRKKETIAKGYLLRPRYLAYADGNFSDVAAILKKMLEFQNKLTGQ